MLRHVYDQDEPPHRAGQDRVFESKKVIGLSIMRMDCADEETNADA